VKKRRSSSMDIKNEKPRVQLSLFFFYLSTFGPLERTNIRVFVRLKLGAIPGDVGAADSHRRVGHFCLEPIDGPLPIAGRLEQELLASAALVGQSDDKLDALVGLFGVRALVLSHYAQ
jgi:hypothetical protein